MKARDYTIINCNGFAVAKKNYELGLNSLYIENKKIKSLIKVSNKNVISLYVDKEIYCECRENN